MWLPKLEGVTRKVMLLSLAIFFADASHSTVIPIFPSFAQKIGASLSMLGSYGSVSAIAMLVFSLPLGRLSDRLGRKVMMIPGLLIFIMVPLFYIVSSTPIHLYPIRALLGLGMGLVFSNGFLLMTEIADPANQSTAQGMYMTSMGMGFTIGPLLGGLTANFYEPKISFLLSSFFALVSIIIILFVSSRVEKIESQGRIRVSLIVKDPRILAAGVANYLNVLMFNALTFFFPVYGKIIGLNEAEIGVGFTTRGVASTAVRLPVGSFTRRFRVLNLMLVGLLLSSVTILSISWSDGLILVSILLGLQGISYGIYLTSGHIYIASNSREDYRGTAMAVYSMFGNLSGIINPLILGLVAEAIGTEGALQFSAGMTLLGIVLVYFMASKNFSTGEFTK